MKKFLRLCMIVTVHCPSAVVLGQDVDVHERYGLIVAIADKDRTSSQIAWELEPQQLKTYLITYDGSSAQILRVTNGVVVQRDDDFVRIGIKRICGVDSEFKYEFCRDSLAITTSREHFVVFDGRIPGNRRESDPPCIHDDLFITYVSDSIISMNRYSGNSEECEPRGFRLTESGWVRRFSSETHLSFSGLFGDAGAAAYAAAARAAQEKWKEGGFDVRCEPDLDDDTGWYIRRHGSKWIPVLFQQNLAVCHFEADIDLNLTGRLDDREHINGEISPEGEVVLAVSKNALSIHSFAGSRLGVNLLEIPIRSRYEPESENIVMVKWATTSAEVERWNHAIGSFK